MNKIYNQKKYLKNLTPDELKELIILGLVSYDSVTHTHYHHYIKSLDGLSITVPPVNEWGNEEFIIVKSYIEETKTNAPIFMLDDLHMYIREGILDIDVSDTLHAYLTSKYKQEYLEVIYHERMKQAQREKVTLLEKGNKIDEQLLKLKLK